jgi:hypothetical protein
MRNETEFDDVQVYSVNNPPKGNALENIVTGGDIVQRQQTQYTTAVQVVKSRELKRVEKLVKSEIELNPEGTYYEWDVWDSRQGKKVPITGITIGTAMSIARNYGNCAVDVQVDETPSHYIFYAVFLDIESGFTFRRAFRQRKNQGLGKNMDKDRAEDITFQIGQSKAIRNVVRGATPSALSSKSIEYAKYLIKEDINSEGVEKSRQGAAENLRKLGVTQEQLEEYTGISDPSQWDIETITKLRTAYGAIRNGDTTISTLFGHTDKSDVKLKGSAEATKVSPKESSAENTPATQGQSTKNSEPEPEKEQESDKQEEPEDLFSKKEEKPEPSKGRGRPRKDDVPFI